MFTKIVMASELERTFKVLHEHYEAKKREKQVANLRKRAADLGFMLVPVLEVVDAPPDQVLEKDGWRRT